MPQSSRTPESYVTRPDTQFTIQNVSLTKVYKLLSTIKASKSTGHDRIPGKLLRDAAEVIAPSLTAIFNASINTGIFPEECIVMEKNALLWNKRSYACLVPVLSLLQDSNMQGRSNDVQSKNS
jgi:hypothetical protein